jgi:predicted HicB family RNase H-like nuclease
MMTTIPPYGFRVRWSDEDDAYVATSPEFDGVSGIGDDPESAVREAQTALALALETFRSEGWTPPPPEKITESSGQFRLRVPRNVHARLAQRAADEGVSLNSYVLSVLAAALGPVGSAPPIAGSRPTPTSRPTRTATARPGRK